jgi:hypothetical protein
MFVLRAKFSRWLRMPAVVLLAALAGYALRGLAHSASQKPPDSIAALVAHLEQHGIALRVVSTAHNGDVCEGAYLTRTSKDWDELSRLMRVPEDLSRWHSTVQVQPEHNTRFRTQARLSWGEGGLVYGQLVLFGDPKLLAEIRAAVGE